MTPDRPIPAALRAMADPAYREFQRRLMPTVPPERVLGVRTPALRQFARQLAGTPEAERFLHTLPHELYEENNLHGFLIERLPDAEAVIAALDRFLPYVDNWATCDMTAPPVFRCRPAALLPAVRRWMAQPEPYAVRYGIVQLMRHYLAPGVFAPAYPAAVAAVRSEAYYVRMACAWYFATALAEQPAAILPYLTEDGALEPWVRRKAVQKALESRRIPAALAARLRALRRKLPPV